MTRLLRSEALETLLAVALPLLDDDVTVVDVFFRLRGNAESTLLQVLSELPLVRVLQTKECPWLVADSEPPTQIKQQEFPKNYHRADKPNGRKTPKLNYSL